ncbi:MAG: fasciclin domain-containing protein [Deltaproteobacteria bacterium]|nr:fasciclin domain-containing protein [Kofleriaceae bacterium]
MKKTLVTFLLVAVAACGGSSTSSQATAPTAPPGEAPPVSADIVDTAIAAGSFKTLVTAVEAAGLVETLKGDGPFTVFAPTDEAFAKLPPGTVEGLLADKAKLTAVLTYHVVAGKVTAADVATISEATTVQGATLAIDTSAGVKVNDASVVTADVMATNGVIHVIDTVLLPPM